MPIFDARGTGASGCFPAVEWNRVQCFVFHVTSRILVSDLVRTFFWEGEDDLDADIWGRALYTARELVALTAEDIVTGNRPALIKKLFSPFPVNKEALLSPVRHNNEGQLLIGSTAAGFFKRKSNFCSNFYGEKTARDDIVLDRYAAGLRKALFCRQEQRFL